MIQNALHGKITKCVIEKETNMKKFICIILAAAAILSFAACGKTENGNPSETAATTDAQTPAAMSGTLEEICTQLYAKTTKIEMNLGEPLEIDLSTPDTISYYIGISSADSIERAVFSEPLIGSIPYSMCLVKTKDGADVDALKNEILNGVNARKWICVSAEKVAVMSCGNVIMMIMAQEEIVDDVCSAFTALSENTASAPLTKAGETDEGIQLPDEITLG